VRFFLDNDVPDAISGVLTAAGHEVTLLRSVLPTDAEDPDALEYAVRHGLLVITCNRDDFLELVTTRTHPGLIILLRRRTRQAVCVALVRLIDAAGESGLRVNVNFA
jgi:predicted nuclease of predicted toxin-antitoxin system